jgi:hypothetical protein
VKLINDRARDQRRKLASADAESVAYWRVAEDQVQIFADAIKEK